MDSVTFIDKVVTPLAGGLGVYFGASYVPALKHLSKGTKVLMALAVVVILGSLKWFANI